MNRNYYCKVSSQEEADEIFEELCAIEESINERFTYTDGWEIVKFDNISWRLAEYPSKNSIEVPSSELIDWVTGKLPKKELDIGALLEEAKRRYPIGTKFRVVHAPDNIWKVTSHDIHESTFVNSINGLHINLIGKCIQGDDEGCKSSSVYLNGKWAEIVEVEKVKSQFEVGKWYYNSSRTYAKCDSIVNNNHFRFKEWICEGNYHKENYSWKYHSNMREVSLEEIQQYLPDGHPDKIKEFVLPEKWCIKVTEKNKDIIHNWKLDNTTCSLFTSSNKYVANNGTWSNNVPSDYTEITFEQFKKYVLKENIDEVKEEDKPIEKWSVGSYVVAIRDGRFGNEETRDPIYKGTISEISHEWGEKDSTIGIKINTTVIKKEIFEWFPTLQEAEKFSKELLGKNKSEDKPLTVDNLIEEEIYYTCYDKDKTFPHIFKFLGETSKGCKNICIHDNKTFTKVNRYFGKCYNKELRLANPEERKWLNVCIKQDRFIPKEELDKYDDEGNWRVKQYPEYYEYLGSGTNGQFTKGKIYKIKNPSNLEAALNFIDDRGIPNGHSPSNKYYFKPSTKEAFDQQNKKEVKQEEEFKVGDWVYADKKLENDYRNSKFIPIFRIEEIIYTDWLRPEKGIGTGIHKKQCRKALPHEIPTNREIFKVGDKLVGKSKVSITDITSISNPLGVVGKYFIADKIEYNDSTVKLWAKGTYWECNIKDVHLYQEESENIKFENAPGMSPTSFQIKLTSPWMHCYMDRTYEPKLKTTLSIETDEELRMVIPRPETKINKFISIE